MPLLFEPNVGQADSQVRFIARARGYTALLTPGGIVFRHAETEVAMKLVNSNPGAAFIGLDQQPARAHYILGDRSPDTREAATFLRVELRGVYPGIDMVFTGQDGNLEYTFVVEPDADPAAIQIAFEGQDALEPVSADRLVVRSAGGYFNHSRPRTTQNAKGQLREVSTRYVDAGGGRIGLVFDGYDRKRPLVVDPVVTYSTYLGGSGNDSVNALAADASGNLYVAGWTESPTIASGGVKFGTGGVDAFVAKLTPSGSVQFITYLGGRGDDRALGIAVDSTGSVALTGSTTSTDFPMLNSAQARTGGSKDAFAVKLAPSGAALVYSTYLGGGGADSGNAVAYDASGNAYIAGDTTSTNFPVQGAFQSSAGGQQDAFVVKLSPAGLVLYSTYFGGAAIDSAKAIAVNGSGQAYIAGGTWSANLPVASALQSSRRGSQDAFVAKLSASGASLVFSTYLGGSGGDSLYSETATGLALDSSGNAYVCGVTASADFPLAGAYQGALSGMSDTFVAKLNAAGTGLAYSTYLGGRSVDNAAAIAVDGSGYAYVVGVTSSSDFPSVSGIRSALAGLYDAYAVKFDPSGRYLVMSTMIGGSDMDEARAIALDPNGGVYVAGATQSSDYPATGLQTSKLSVLSGFVAKLTSTGTYIPELFAVRVNAGGPAFYDAQGHYWSADPISGNSYSTSNSITDTNDPTLYQTEHYSTSTLTYQFTVPNGIHTVTLKFAEIWFTSAGQRVFHVAVNGNVVKSNLDLYSAAGGAYRAYDLTCQVAVTGGQITVSLIPVTGSPKISAISIVQTSTAPDFAMFAPESRNVAPGNSASTQVQITAVNGFTNAIAMSVSGMPSGVSASFSPASLTGTGSTSLRFTAASSTALGSYPVTITASGGGVSHSSSLILVVAASTSTFKTIRINAGGPAYTDSQQAVWSADPVAGSSYSTTTGIANTSDPKLYQSERYSGSGNLTYSFTAPNGTYTATLKFAEIWFTSAGQRVFNIVLNGVTVATNFDPFVAAGGAYKAYDASYPVTVTNGNITLSLVPVVGSPKISGIAIVQNSEDGGGTTSVRVSTRDAAYTDSAGNVWSADTVAGGHYQTGFTILNTADPKLYQTEHFSNGSLTYPFTMANGTYTVTLKFAEIWYTSAGQRVFNIVINGATMATNFDPFVAAGGAYRAYDVSYPVTVTGGQINVTLVPVVGSPKISAIAIQ